MIRIIADSTCDLTKEEALSMNIDVVPLTINFEGEIYRDGVDLSHAEFYHKLRQAKTLPTTSQVNPGQFAEVFAPHLQSGDDLIVITLAADLSATLQSAVIAAQDFDSLHIHIVDSRSATFGEALLIRQAVKMRDEAQLSAQEIAERLRILAPRLRIYAVVDTLKYLKMGGETQQRLRFGRRSPRDQADCQG